MFKNKVLDWAIAGYCDWKQRRYWISIPIPWNLFPPQSYVRRVITNKICADIVHSIFKKFVQLLLFWQAPKGEFKRLTYCVIDFDKDAAWMQLIRECRSIFSWITILFNQGLASKPFNYPWVVNNLMDLVSDHLKVTFFPDN